MLSYSWRMARSTRLEVNLGICSSDQVEIKFDLIVSELKQTELKKALQAVYFTLWSMLVKSIENCLLLCIKWFQVCFFSKVTIFLSWMTGPYFLVTPNSYRMCGESLGPLTLHSHGSTARENPTSLRYNLLLYIVWEQWVFWSSYSDYSLHGKPSK